MGAVKHRTFTSAEYAADPQSVVAAAVATGQATVVREDGTARVVISIPTADLPTMETSDTLLRDLLARIHRDGGHHTATVGLEQSVADADARVVQWLAADNDNPMSVAEYGCDCGQVPNSRHLDSNGHLPGCNAEWRRHEERDRLDNPPPPVICVWCGERYRGYPGFSSKTAPPMTEVLTQGDDCAAVAYEHEGQWLVEGFYGSSHFDMNLYLFVRNPPTERADPVCDACIQKKIDAGDLVFLREGNGGGL